jgi:hypothetical protein
MSRPRRAADRNQAKVLTKEPTVFRKLTLAAVVVLFVAVSARADDGKRKCWRYKNDDGVGYFLYDSVTGWTETTPSGDLYNFGTEKRFRKYIEARDNQRQGSIRFYADHCDIRWDGDKEWTYLYAGGWDYRTTYVEEWTDKHNKPHTTTFQLGTGNTWTVTWSNTPGSDSLQEVKRSDDCITLLRADMDLHYRLYDAQIAIGKPKRGSYSTYHKGHWDDGTAVQIDP